MEQAISPGGEVTGVIGNLGVMYGLRFSLIVDGKRFTLTSAEMSALDLPISQFPPLEGNSKLLLCLINQLKDSESFQLIVKYIFPMRKVLSCLAIYNDMAFLPSIGEWTVESGLTYGLSAGAILGKPGMSVDIDRAGDGAIEEIDVAEKVGWASWNDRTTSWTPFVKEWDDWDQDLLKKSRQRLKRLFRSQYNSRDFKPGQLPDLGINGPGQIFMRRLKAGMLPRPGAKVLPWWKKRKIKSNPFNSDGILCDKSDE